MLKLGIGQNNNSDALKGLQDPHGVDQEPRNRLEAKLCMYDTARGGEFGI